MLIFVVSRNGNKTKVQAMSKEVALIVWVEERLDSIWLWTVALETYFAESAKNCEQHYFSQVIQS